MTNELSPLFLEQKAPIFHCRVEHENLGNTWGGEDGGMKDDRFDFSLPGHVRDKMS